MTIEATNAPQPAFSTPKTGAGTAAKSGVADGDFETFLKMLTVQMQNQDPLNPVDSSDYAVQLATFSGVEQQVRTNDLLSSMGGDSSLSGLSNLAGWVGMDARIASDTVSFDGSAQELHFTKDPAAKKTELVISTPAGNEIQRIDVSDENSPYLWTGRSAEGAPLLTGNYMIDLLHTDSGGEQTNAVVQTYATVSEVRTGAAGTEVVLADGRALSTADVTALRAPR